MKNTTEPFGISIGTPSSSPSPGRGARRMRWLFGTIQVGPDATVQSSSDQTATPLMAYSG